MNDRLESDWYIKRGLDDDDYVLLWPPSEWAIGIAVLGVLLLLHHILLGLLGLGLTLVLLMKGRSNQRGSKAHRLWQLQLLHGKKGLDFAPPAHATRFDN